MNRRLARLAAPLLLLAAGVAQAQLIDDVDFRQEGADAVLQIRFVTPVQLRRVNVPRSGDTAQVYYDLLNPAEALKDVPSERRVPGAGALPELTVSDEAAPQRARDRRLLLRLSRAVPFKVRAGRGDRQIELVLTGLGAAIPAPAANGAVAAAAAPAEIEQQAAMLLAAAKAAEDQQDHASALDKLNQLLNLPANGSTREAQALAGLVRERAGDPVRARAEYETFLQLFPTGPDAERVRAALAALPAAAPAAAPAPAQRAKPAVEASSTLAGSVSAYYYGGASKVRTQEFQDSPISGLPELVSDNTLADTDQKQWQTSVDLNWRYRDADTDMRFVFRDAYTLDQLDSDKSRNRLSALYVEHRALALGTNVRLGRQSPTGLGVLGRFDGVQASWTVVPKWRVTALAGVPADKLLDSRRHFYGGAIEADALLPHLSGNVYANRQMIDGELDRNALGTELRYFNGGVSATGILEGDRSIRALNIASLQGTWQLEDSSVLNFLYDRRKTPLLMLGNALFFQDPNQPLATRLRDLLDAGATLGQLRQRVKDTTSNTTQALLGATLPLNRTWQIGADVRLTDVGEIAPVPDILPSGQGRSRNHAAGAQLIGSNLYSSRDTHVFALSLMRGSNYSLTDPVTISRYNAQLLSYNNSSQLTEALLLEPSLRWYRQFDNAGVRVTRWTPGLRFSWRVLQQLALESELSGELSRSRGPSRNERSHRYFYYLGARYDF